MKRFLAIAACATIIGGTVSPAFSTTVTIDKQSANTGYAGQLTVLSSGVNNYVWKNGDTNSVDVKLVSPGTLKVAGYDSELQNGLLQATDGTLNLIDGVLTLNTDSYINSEVITNLSDGTVLSVAGGNAYLGSDDDISLGTFIVSNGSLNVSSSDITGPIISTGGSTLFTEGSADYVEVSGGSVNFNDSIINNANVLGGTLIFTGGNVGGDINSLNNSTLELHNSTFKNVAITSGTTIINNSSKTGEYTQTGGSTIIAGTGFDLNNENDYIANTAVTINHAGTLDISKGTVESNNTMIIGSGGNLNVKGGKVTLDNSDTWNGNTTLSSGSLALVGITKGTNATYKQTGGTVDITGDFDLNNSSDSISAGTVNIGTYDTEGYVTVSKGTIGSGATINIEEEGVIELTGGSVSLDSSDSWYGVVGVSQGTLNLNNVTKNSAGIFVQENGTTNITGSNFSMNNGLDEVTGGNLNIGNETTSGTLGVKGATIANGVNVNLATNSNINFSSGSISLDADDTWGGKIDMSGGTLNIDNVSKTGSLVQTNGTTNVTGTNFSLNNSADNISGGYLNVGDGVSNSKLTVSQGSITGNVTVNMADKSALNLTGGSVVLDADDTIGGDFDVSGGSLSISTKEDLNSDIYISGGSTSLEVKETMNGNIDISSGSLALVGIKKNETAKFTQTGGSTTITGKSFDLNNEYDLITGGELKIGNGINSSKLTVSQGAISDTNLTISKNSTLDITGGNVDVGSDSTWNGAINITGGNLTLDEVTKTNTASFTQTNGKTTVTGNGFDLDNIDDIVSGGTFNIGNKTTSTEVKVSQGYIESNANVNINRNGKLTVSGGEVNLDKLDSWRGDLNVTDGTLTITDLNKNAAAKFTQSGGNTTIDSEYFDLNNEGDKISGGRLDVANGTTLDISQGSIESGVKLKLNNGTITNVSGGSLTLDNTDTWNGNVNVNGGSLALVGVTNKNATLTQTKGTTTVTGLGFDLDNKSDSVTGGTLNIGDGTTTSSLNVSNGIIGGNSKVNIKNAGSLNVTGGNVSLNDDTVWDGTVNVSKGTLNINSVTKNTNGVLSQNDGTVTITGSAFSLNNASDSIAGGTFNVGNGTAATTLKVEGGTINSNATTNINTNASLDIKGGKVNLNKGDTWNGNVNVDGGSLALIGITKSADATLTQSSGTTSISDSTFILDNANDILSGGTLNIGTTSSESTLVVSKGTVGKDVNTNIALGSSIDITGGKVTLNNSDNWDGKVNLSNGSLNMSGIDKNPAGILNQTGGTLTVTNTGNTLNNDNDVISGGNLVIGTEAESGTLNVKNGIIESDSVVTINKKGVLNVNGGTTTIDANDKWAGEVVVSNGTLNLKSNKENTRAMTTAKFNQIGGTTNIEDSTLTLSNSDSKITGGTVNILSTGNLNVNNSSENVSELNSTGGKLSIGIGSKYTTTAGTIDGDSKVDIVGGATFALDGENTNVTLDGQNDIVSGNLSVNKGTLNLADGVVKTTTTSGTFNQTGGTTNISKSHLVLNESGSKISGGTVNVLENSELVAGNAVKHSSVINVSDSKFAITDNSTYTTTGGIVDTTSKVTVESASKLHLNGKESEVHLNKNDNIAGHIQVTEGSLYISEDLTKVTHSDGTFVQTGGTTTLNDASLILSDSQSSITGGNLNLQKGSTLTVVQDEAYTGGNIVIDDTSVMNYLASKGLVQIGDGNQINIDTSGLINMANNVRTNSVVNNLTINNGELGGGVANFAIDIHARNNLNTSSDTITAESIKVATSDTEGTIKISDFNLNGDIYGYDAPIDRSIRLGKIFQTEDLGKEVTFAATDKEIFTPIGYYKLNPSSANDGSYTLDLTRFNPEVYRGQVSSMASYMNQIAFNDVLFNRAHVRQFASNGNQMFKNRTAVLDGNASYERTLRDGQIWTEVYGNLETMKLNQGLDKVRNNSWGFIVGGDFGLRELKNGWSWMPTAYLAYNGGRQTYNRVGMWQNGAQAGFMGTFMKDKQMHSALAYAGVYGANIDVAGYSEDAFNYFIGLASRSSYDWKIGEHFKIQPSLTLAYNMFGQQNWHSDFGQMSMTAGFLNGFNIAPGMNFVIDHESWSTYATVAYAWNFIPGMGGEAGNVGLNDIRMENGYLQYGFGFTKSFSDTFNMYGQATIRNIGRTGVIFQGGMNWRL